MLINEYFSPGRPALCDSSHRMKILISSGKGQGNNYGVPGIIPPELSKIDIAKRLWGPYAKTFNRAKRELVRPYLADLDSMTILSPLKIPKKIVLTNACRLFCPIP